jgi:hypothetical protein
VELEQEAHDSTLPPAFRQTVRAVLLQPSDRLAGVQASRRIDAKPTDDLVGADGVPGARTRLRPGFDCCFHR